MRKWIDRTARGISGLKLMMAQRARGCRVDSWGFIDSEFLIMLRIYDVRPAD